VRKSFRNEIRIVCDTGFQPVRRARHGLEAHVTVTAALLVVAMSAVVGLLTSCKREDRGLRVEPPAASSADLPTATPFHVGPSTEPAHVVSGYDENAYALQQGQLLYNNFNCVGCHFHGDGGIGPPLMDDKWIYGSAPDQIFATIVQGSPNGMPSFKGKIPDYRVWQIVAYVRTSANARAESVSAPTTRAPSSPSAARPSAGRNPPHDPPSPIPKPTALRWSIWPR